MGLCPLYTLYCSVYKIINCEIISEQKKIFLVAFLTHFLLCQFLALYAVLGERELSFVGPLNVDLHESLVFYRGR